MKKKTTHYLKGYPPIGTACGLDYYKPKCTYMEEEVDCPECVKWLKEWRDRTEKAGCK